jgi:hypothetical protein
VSIDAPARLPRPVTGTSQTFRAVSRQPPACRSWSAEAQPGNAVRRRRGWRLCLQWRRTGGVVGDQQFRVVPPEAQDDGFEATFHVKRKPHTSAALGPIQKPQTICHLCPVTTCRHGVERWLIREIGGLQHPSAAGLRSAGNSDLVPAALTMTAFRVCRSLQELSTLRSGADLGILTA